MLSNLYKKQLSSRTVFFILFIIGLVIYLPYINNSFYLDDHTWYAELQFNVKINPLTGFWDVRGADLDMNRIIGVWWADAGSDFARFFRPLFSIIFTLFYHLFGRNAALTLHILSVVLHIVVSFLTFIMLRKLSGNYFISLLSAIIYLISPLLTMAVGWISNATDLYAALFMLSALLLHIRFREKGGFVYAVLSNVSILLALTSKEIGIAAPMAIIVYELVFNESERGIISGFIHKWKYWLTSFALIVIYLLFYKLAGFGTNNLYYYNPFTDPVGCLFNISIGFPIILTGFLSNLPIGIIMFMPSIKPAVAVLGIILFVIFVLALLPYRKNAVLLFCFIMFIITTIPQLLTDASPRLLYVPLIFGCYLLGFLIMQIRPLKKRYSQESPAGIKYLTNIYGWYLAVTMIFLSLLFDAGSVQSYMKTWTFPDKVFEQSKVYVDTTVHKNIVYLNTPGFLFTLYGYEIFLTNHYMDSLYMLSSFNGRVWMRQLSDSSIELKTDDRGWLTNTFALVLRKEPELHIGKKYETDLFTATIESVTPDKRDLLQTRFDFRRNLHDPSVLFLYYDGTGVKRWVFTNQLNVWLLLGGSSDMLENLM